MTKVQEDIATSFPDEIYVETINGGFCDTDDVYVIASYNDTLYQYIIHPDGETTRQTFSVTKSEDYSLWSMEEHDWATSYPTVKAGDESFDVVVENEIKKEKENKKMDLEELYLDLVREYVSRHRADLEEKKEDTKRERFLAYAEDSIEDKIDWVIEAYYDNYDFCDVDVSDSDIEDVLIDEGILD